MGLGKKLQLTAICIIADTPTASDDRWCSNLLSEGGALPQEDRAIEALPAG
jgi:hypothetical protein